MLARSYVKSMVRRLTETCGRVERGIVKPDPGERRLTPVSRKIAQSDGLSFIREAPRGDQWGRGFLCSGSSITGMREVQMTRDCVHDWQKEYYGWRFSKCEVFVAFGCEPWAFFDESMTMTVTNRLTTI